MSVAVAPLPIEDLLRALVVGQDAAIDAIMPRIHTWRANLAPPRRPIATFLLAGPSGTGKTHLVESLASVLHGCLFGEMVLKIDCAEFQQEHEIAKLIGAPPGYVGHAAPGYASATPALLSTARIKAFRSHACDASIILFDEIEKASEALWRLLLGVLDKATLRTGTNEDVSFEQAMIFMTCNLGAHAIGEALNAPRFGYDVLHPLPERSVDSIANRAIRQKFSPEFVNRIDEIAVFRPLSRESLARILDGYVAEYNRFVGIRRPAQFYRLDLTAAAREWLIDTGTKPEYGARELRRVFERHVLNPIAREVAGGIHGQSVIADVRGGRIAIEWQANARCA